MPDKPPVPPKLHKLYLASKRLVIAKKRRDCLRKNYLTLGWISMQLRKQAENPSAPLDPKPDLGPEALERVRVNTADVESE
jgi:hypothetical protein